MVLTIDKEAVSSLAAKPSANKIRTTSAKSDDVTTKKRHGHARVRTPSIPLDMPGRYGTGNVLAVTGWSASTLWNRIREGRFPAPRKDGNRAWWPTSVVREALGL